MQHYPWLFTLIDASWQVDKVQSICWCICQHTSPQINQISLQTWSAWFTDNVHICNWRSPQTDQHIRDVIFLSRPNPKAPFVFFAFLHNLRNAPTESSYYFVLYVLVLLKFYLCSNFTIELRKHKRSGSDQMPFCPTMWYGFEPHQYLK